MVEGGRSRLCLSIATHATDVGRTLVAGNCRTRLRLESWRPRARCPRRLQVDNPEQVRAANNGPPLPNPRLNGTGRGGPVRISARAARAAIRSRGRVERETH